METRTQPKRAARSASFESPRLSRSRRPVSMWVICRLTQRKAISSSSSTESARSRIVEIVSNKHTQKSKGFAFVQMQSIEEAKRAVAELHDKDYMGRKLVVSGAKAVEEKRGERRQPE